MKPVTHVGIQHRPWPLYGPPLHLVNDESNSTIPYNPQEHILITKEMRARWAAEEESARLLKGSIRLGFLIGLVLILIGILTGCSLCRHSALKTAERMESTGRPAKIATYKVGIDGLVYGLGVWKYHAQAVTWQGGKMLWIGEFGQLSETSTFRVAGDLTLWHPIDYRLALERKGETP